MGMWMMMLQLLPFLLKASAIVCSSLLLASSSGYSLSPSSAAIPPISHGESSANISPIPSSSPSGKSVSPPLSALPPLELDNAPQRLRGPATSVPPSDPTKVPPNDFSALHTPPPMNSQGPVQVSPLSGARSELPSTKHPVMAPQSPVDDESSLKKPPPNSLLHTPIAPAPVEPTLRDLPPTMPPRLHKNGSPQIAPTVAAAAEPPSKKPSQNLPTRQRVVVRSSPQPSPREEGPPDTYITVPIAPATVQPPLGELPQSPPTMQPPVVTGSLPPSPYGRRALDTPPPVLVPPVPVEEPLRRSPPAMPPVEIGPTPPSRHEYGSTNAPIPMRIAPRTSATEHNRKWKGTPIGHSVKHAVSPSSSPAAPVASPSSKVLGHTHPVHQRLHEEPPSSSPVKQDASTPLPSTNGERVASPVAAPPNRLTHHDINAHSSPAKAPSAHKNARHSLWHHFVKGNITAPPLWHPVPPRASTVQGPSFAPMPSFASNSDPKSTLRHHIAHPPPSIAPVPSFGPSSNPKSNLRQHIAHPPLNPGPPPSSTISPSWSSARNPKMLFPHPFVLPPPPPNEDCSSLICMEPFTTPPPKSSCDCALPMQIGLRLSIALYTFFPLVLSLAHEISSGVLMDLSQVRIMGANSANQYPEKTNVFIDLVPLGGQFNNTTAFLTFQKFWHKDVNINASFFGNYDVLYVRYPGLPPSPPSAPSNDVTINSDPYSGDNGRNIHPLGVDVTKRRRRSGPNRSLIAVIALSASGAVILCCAVAWMLLFKHRDRVLQSDPTPPTTIPSLGRSPRVAASVTRSGPNSPSLSFSSSFAAYRGSAKTFSVTEIERVTDNFNEKRVLGEGGFGRVYSGALEDGTKVAVKVLKRDDHQGGREFFAEVEMLSRLHHRNVVKLIGICLEERARCLVYELVPNGSVESHLHGVDKERAPLDWNARVKIALGAARGLAYLHEDSSPRVIHRDFKSSNILLEHDFTPKVSDFGLARAAFDEENRHISTRVMGTFGYVAPEYAMTGHLLVKSDVYSYGVVLLELLTGRKPVDMSLPPGQENLVSWARPFLTTKEGLEFVVDGSLGPGFLFDSVAKVAAIASMCVQPEVSHRPFMGEVVQALKLVCSETRDLESQNCDDQENHACSARPVDDCGLADADLNTRSHRSSSDCEVDLERGHSMSDLLSPSMRYGVRECGSHGRSAGRRARRLWKKMRRLSGGSVSEHGVVFRLWPASN